MSEEDKKTEEIKALLRKKLEGLPPAEDGWNVPSPGVWAGLSEELAATAKPKQTSNWVARLATIIAALLVILFWRECSNQRQLTNLKSEVEKVSMAYDKLQETCNEKQSAVMPVTTQNAADIASPILPKKSANTTVLSKIGQSKTVKSPPLSLFAQPIWKNSSSKTTKSSFNAQTGVNDPAPVALFQDSSFQNAGITAVLSQKQTLPKMLPMLSISGFENNLTNPQLNLQLPNPNKNGSSVMLLASLYSGLALTGNRLVGQKPAIITDQKALLTWRTGLGLQAAFNRHWSIISGVEYQLSRVETDYKLAVPYTHNGEVQHDDGNYDNQYKHSLPSALGNYPLEMVLTRVSNATIPEGEVMNLDLRIRQKTQFISLPLQLRYGLGSKNWQFGIRAGVVANHDLTVESETPNLKSLHSAIHQRHTSIGAPSISDLKKWTFDYAFGLDCRYQITPRFGLNAHANLQMGATPIYEDEAVKNYLNALGLNLGILYTIR